MRSLVFMILCGLLTFSGCKGPADDGGQNKPGPKPKPTIGPADSPKKPTEKKPEVKTKPKPKPKPLAKSAFKVDGIVQNVQLDWFDKPEARKKGWLKLKVASDAGDLDNNVKIRVYKPGADSEESKPILQGWSNRYLKLAPGTYDIRVRYRESKLASGEGWIRKVTLKEAKLLRLNVLLNYSVGRLKIQANNLKKDVSKKTIVMVYKPGVKETEEIKPLMRFWASKVVTLPSQTFDLLLRYRESKLATVEKWIRGVKIPPKRTFLKKELDLGFKFALLKFEISNLGKPLEGRVAYAIFKPGANDQVDKPLATGWSTRNAPLPEGKYDVRLRYRPGPAADKTVWHKGLVVGGSGEIQSLKSDLKFKVGTLSVMALRGDTDLRTRAVVKVYAAGKKDKSLVNAWSKHKIVLPVGKYDVFVSHKKNEHMEKNVKIKKGATRKLTIDLNR